MSAVPTVACNPYRGVGPAEPTPRSGTSRECLRAPQVALTSNDTLPRLSSRCGYAIALTLQRTKAPAAGFERSPAAPFPPGDTPVSTLAENSPATLAPTDPLPNGFGKPRTPRRGFFGGRP